MVDISKHTRIEMQVRLPRAITLAVSGGLDSMVLLDFLVNNHEVNIVYVNHNTYDSDDRAQELVEKAASHYGCGYDIFTLPREKPRGYSIEEWWRVKRYEIFHAYDRPVITCHHLDDCVETWVWSSLCGAGKIIPFNNRNVFRPFRLTKRAALEFRAANLNLQWVEDESNADMRLTRNHIRQELIPKCLQVNPGLHKTIARKVMDDPGTLARWAVLGE